MDGWKCWYCEMNTADCLHHIMGRGGNSKPRCEFSILNAAPMCNNKCHIPNHGKISTEGYRKIFLQKTFDYLTNIGYEFKDQDRNFVKKYAALYRRDQVSLARKGLNEYDIQGDPLERPEQPKESVPYVHAPVPKPTKVRRK